MEKETTEEKRDEMKETGSMKLDSNNRKHNVRLLTIIGEIEGHEAVSGNTKATKYEHLLPMLAEVEDSEEIDGLLILLNTMGGDVEAGLSIAEMIASMSKPTVSLVLGDSHSIGVPLAVSTDYSFIAPTATMIIHPVRMNGTIIGAPQTFDYFKMIQDRIVRFISSHSKVSEDELEKMMMNTGILTKDLGTILVGQEAVDKGLVNGVGGIKEAFAKMQELMNEKGKEHD